MLKQILNPLVAFVWISTTLSAQSVFMLTRTNPTEQMAPGDVLVLDLNEYFQTYEAPGPVAIFTYYRLCYDEDREVYFPAKLSSGGWAEKEDSATDIRPTFKLIEEKNNGEKYENIYEFGPDDFSWEEELITLTVELFGDEAPTTVANFLSYAKRGYYDRTIIHRNEPGIIQAGGWRVADESSDFILDTIESLDPIELERPRTNTLGTLSMARQSSPNSATNQFFFNLEDNSDIFSDLFAVFGEVIEADIEKLVALGNVPTWDLTSIYTQLGIAFANTPLWASPWEYEKKENYVYFNSVDVPEGDSSGVTYSWEVASENITDENKKSFDISINESTGKLTIRRLNSGTLGIVVTGTKGEESVSFNLNLQGSDERIIDYFGGFTLFGLDEAYISNWFGSFSVSAKGYPYIDSDSWGEIALYETPFEAGSNRFFKDTISGTDFYFWTSASLYGSNTAVYNLNENKTDNTWYKVVFSTSDPSLRFFYDYKKQVWLDANFEIIEE